MTEEVKPEVIKKTQDILGKFIKKPTLTEKLLKKPPFRFLHDICTSVMKEHGFLETVLNSPDDRIENIKVKEDKIKFLQKVIAAVETANGIKINVKPTKIVAGLEATKTNELLQALGKVLEKQQLESKSSKSKITKTKSTKKMSKEVKEEPPDKNKNVYNKVPNKIVENGVNQTPLASPKNDLPKNIEEPQLKTNGETLKNEKFEERNFNTEAINEKSEGKRKENILVRKPNSGAGESKDVPNTDRIKINREEGQGDQDILAKEEVIRNSDIKTGKPKQRRLSIQNLPDASKEAVENNEPLKGDSEKNINEKIHLLNKSDTILKEQNRTIPSPTDKVNFSKTDNQFGKEGMLVSRPRTGIRPTTARPASARPAAPRIRDKGEVTVMEEVIKPASGKVQVIEDKDTSNDVEDDENLITLETANDILVEEQKPDLQTDISSVGQEHGHLVEQILEAQRELEDDSRFTEQKATVKTEIEWESNKNKEIENSELEKLRMNIQTLTRKANPLGKLLDFFQEDIETITKELDSWKDKNSSLSRQIAHEKSITEQYVEPLKIHLKELQQSIDEQLEKISIVKANIIKNNEKIHKFLTGIN